MAIVLPTAGALTCLTLTFSLSLSLTHTHTHRTNGSLPCSPLSPKMSHSFVLKKQSKATGVSLIVRNPKVSREKESVSFFCCFSAYLYLIISLFSQYLILIIIIISAILCYEEHCHTYLSQLVHHRYACHCYLW